MADVTKEIVLEVGLKDSTAQGTTSAKQRLRELQKTLIDMSLAGQEGTKAFKEMEQEAGKLKDQIGDTGQRIKNLASDTRNIDTFVSAVQGITAGFQIAQGAAALFGDENKDLQESLLKVQGAMALANGVQQVANLLNKDSILITQGQAAAQKLYALAVGTSTGALRAFRIALAATGIGAIVVALGFAAEAMGLFSSKTKENTEAQQKNKKALEDTVGTLEYYERKLKANGATEGDLAKGRRAALVAEKEELDRKLAEDIARFDVKNDKYQTSLRNELDLLDTKIKEESKIIKAEEDARNKATVKKVADRQNLGTVEVMQAKTTADALVQITADQNAKQDALNAQAVQTEMERRKKFNEDMKANEKALADFKQQVTMDSLQSIAQILQSFGSKSKGIALAALALEKGSAIAQVIINLQKEMAGNTANAALNPANAVTGGAAGLAQAKALNTLSKIRAGLRIAAITAAGIQAGKSITSGGDSGSIPAGGGPTGGGAPGAAAPPPIFANPNVTDLSGFGQSQGQGSSPMRAYVVERDITQSTRRVRRLEEFATLGA
jgi:hypothetical protein